MNNATDRGSLDHVSDFDEHQALLHWATTRIDQLAHENDAREHLGTLVDWIAHFTRERFGFQQRLLTESRQQRDWVLRRITVHGEFRKRLARVCIASMFEDPARVTEQLRALCDDLLADAQTQEKLLSEVVGQCGAVPRLRHKPRQGQLLVAIAAHREPPRAGEFAAGIR